MSAAGVMHPSFAHRAEYAALRSAVAAMERLSFRRAGSVGERIGQFGYRPLGIRRAVVERQLTAAFPDRSAAEIERIARAAYANLGRTSVETAILPSYGPDQIIDLFEDVQGWNIVEALLSRGRGLIIVTGHLGNWELGGAYAAARGLPIDAVARHMANPLFDGYLTRTRQRIGMSVVHDEEAVRRVPRSLRGGRAVAFLVDQGAVGLASTWVPFFGRYAKTPRGPAVFALRLDTPIVFGVALRRPSGRFQLSFEHIEARDTGDREADVDRIVADYTAALERWVRRAPEQYFWHHRRWKHQRPGTPPELGDPL
ncbi:MAG TPA: lysophospholipid acyltransferase family protein [Gemmatimonadaceae bacterium]|jgi:Kdo2-lipid IVA lauroyltransferase/acyltransferase|nr:lysophospholipid acyltransferase family protein [Gemmatimonadaceae bacterium]